MNRTSDASQFSQRSWVLFAMGLALIDAGQIAMMERYRAVSEARA
jgi:hypothetical protein